MWARTETCTFRILSRDQDWLKRRRIVKHIPKMMICRARRSSCLGDIGSIPIYLTLGCHLGIFRHSTTQTIGSCSADRACGSLNGNRGTDWTKTNPPHILRVENVCRTFLTLIHSCLHLPKIPTRFYIPICCGPLQAPYIFWIALVSTRLVNVIE